MSKQIFSHYEVVNFSGECLFVDPCYAICNSYIINQRLMGIRPKPVYIEVD